MNLACKRLQLDEVWGKGRGSLPASAGYRYLHAERPRFFQVLGVFAEFERAMIRERVMAGLARARALGKRLGRRRLEDTDRSKMARIRSLREKDHAFRRISADLGVGVGTVLRVLPESAPRSLSPVHGNLLSIHREPTAWRTVPSR